MAGLQQVEAPQVFLNKDPESIIVEGSLRSGAPDGVAGAEVSPTRPSSLSLGNSIPGVSHLIVVGFSKNIHNGPNYLDKEPSGLFSALLPSRVKAGEQSRGLSRPPQGDGTGTGPDFLLLDACDCAAKPGGPPLAMFSRSSPLKLDPRRRRPITLFISFVALDVGVRKLSDLPTNC